MFSIKNLHFYGHLFIGLILTGLIGYGYFIGDNNTVLIASAIMVRPLNVVMKRYYNDYKYYFHGVVTMLVLFIVGSIYSKYVDHTLLYAVFSIMTVMQAISLIEYYLKKYYNFDV